MAVAREQGQPRDRESPRCFDALNPFGFNIPRWRRESDADFLAMPGNHLAVSLKAIQLDNENKRVRYRDRSINAQARAAR